MVTTTTQTVTVDRVSNGGNSIAQQQHGGKSIHVPAGEVGETYEVRLVEKGGYFEAHLVDQMDSVQPRGPSIGPDTSDVGKSLLDPERNHSHSYEIRNSPGGGKLRSNNPSGQRMRSDLSRRKK
ncbi:hypothetical protein SAMN04488063_2978 [Halopelagius inordinatus]|uniref:TRAM domain-containing protein n=1 Tax=Halopelagius inordinatus TaxID=553467 RepID=A0A1I2UY20_9EURY|nr:hypothetical protein SAMN04488063_2978 [Halopelagius inordinatus]